MLTWMRSYGEVQRIGVESTGSYGAGLLRFLQLAGLTVLEVTTPDKQDRRKRGTTISTLRTPPMPRSQANAPSRHAAAMA